MIKGILFDKDGTLIEFEKTWHQIMTLIFSELQSKYLSKDQTNHLKEFSGYKDKAFEKESIIQYKSTREIIGCWLELLGKDTGLTEDILVKLFDRAAVDQSIEVETLKGTREGLDYLRYKGYPVGIATADTYHSAKHSLAQAKIESYFSFIGSDDGVMIAKPHSDMAKRFCHMHDIPMEDLLIVGDSINDYRFADNSGAKFAGIISGHSTLKDLDGEILLVSNLVDLIEVMEL